MEETIIINPDLDEVKFDDYYSQKFYCNNCGNATGLGFDGVKVIIKKGVKRPSSIICPNCGCDTQKEKKKPSTN